MRMKTLLLSSLVLGGALFGGGCIGGDMWSWLDFGIGLVGSAALTPIIAGLGLAT